MDCEKCGGQCWDESQGKFWNGGKNQQGKQKPRWKCKDKEGCGWVKYEAKTPAPSNADRGSQGQPGANARPSGPLAPVYKECYAAAALTVTHFAKQYGLMATVQDITAAAATIFIQASQSGRPILGPKPAPAPAKRSDALDPYIDPDEVM